MGTENLNPSLAKTSSSWPIVRGSVHDVVTFESSVDFDYDDAYHHQDYPNDNDNDNDNDQAVAVSLTPKSNLKPPIVLRRPSPDSAPCEITIGFKQLHEIRQVYVRSTARVYEIYYATNDKGENEYLCTVRCGVAVKNEEPLQEAALSSSSSTSNRCVEEGHSITESGSSTNEDGWVDVKVSDNSGFDHRDQSLSKEQEGFMEQGDQDLFEATAEISDADPILSVTLRLLSIQSGDYIYIDEVYVFADPVVSSADMDSSEKTLGNSSGSALMSMLVPTLLQMSKSRANQIQEHNHSTAGEKRKQQNAENKSTGAAIHSNAFCLEGKESTLVNGESLKVSESEAPLQTPDPQITPYSTSREIPCSHMQRLLDELVSRVARIEHFCLRFEENLLKPITSMEARLERVEQQLESCLKTSQFPRTAGSRFSAPAFSCRDTESNNICTDGNDYPGTRLEDNNNIHYEEHHEELPTPPSDVSPSSNHVQSLDTPSSTCVSQLLPSLVVTAPDFSNVDDEEDNDTAEAINDLPNDSPKKSLSIDDALASALAGFLSSTATNPLECIDKVEEEEADHPIVKGSSNTLLLQSDDLQLPSEPINVDSEAAGISCKDLVVSKQESPSADNCSKETIEAVDKQDHNFEEEGNKQHERSSVDNVFYLDRGEWEDSGLIAEIKSNEFEDNLNQTFVSCYSDNFKEGAVDNTDVLQNILKLPSPRTVDFEIPILDVKFLSLEDSSAKSPLEALLIDVPEFQSEVPCLKENNECLLGEQNGLLVIENEESTISSEAKNDQLCLDNSDSGCMTLNTEKELHDPHESSSQDTCASLI